jgi:uncharacterized membrane protein YccC
VVGASALRWLRRHDQDYLVTRRATRVTVVASLVFYGCLYGLGDTTLATYALFSVIALGVLSQVPGPPRQRAGTLLAALPAVWLLVTAGTLVAEHIWLAVAGMFAVGFAVSFAGVGGPRLVGLANGLQLFFILPCFPPFAPHTLPERLVGASLGLAVLAAAEVLLWPDPAPAGYPRRLAAAVEAWAALVETVAGVLAGVPGARDRLPAMREAARQAAQALRLSHLPAAVRPASAGLRDRALRHAAAALRYLMGEANRLLPGTVDATVADDVAALLLRQAADTARGAGRTLTGGPPVLPGALHAASHDFDAGRAERHAALARRDVRRNQMRVDAITLEVAEGVRTLGVAARLAAGFPVSGEDLAGHGSEQFWYAYRSRPALWWRQFLAHLTPRSVYFQQALRVAVGLSVARLVAGTFNLQHGFWVLLATLTLMRTSAADTRTTLRPALAGTLAGAAAAAVLTVLVHQPSVYQAALPVAMLIGFWLGPLLGLAWAQGLFTVVVTMVFAQLTPANWQLAEARLVNVLIGGFVGALTGLLAWPRGGSGELRRAVANCLDASTMATTQTVAALCRPAAADGREADRDGTRESRRAGEEPLDAMPRARRALILAEASYTQYQSERRDPRMAEVDWQAALVAAHRMVCGGEDLRSRYPPGSLAGWPGVAERLVGFAGRLRAAFLALGRELRTGHLGRHVPVPPAPGDVLERVDAVSVDDALGPHAQHLVDVEVWLAGLRANLSRIQSRPAGSAPVPPSADRRQA